MKPTNHPDYVYRPWSDERKRAASRSAKERLKQKRRAWNAALSAVLTELAAAKSLAEARKRVRGLWKAPGRAVPVPAPARADE